jgi:hypothetical protein
MINENRMQSDVIVAIVTDVLIGNEHARNLNREKTFPFGFGKVM